jgi:hypothetical protein
MKKYLPIILFASGALVFIGGIFVVKGQKKTPIPQATIEPDGVVAEIPLESRPFTSLTPKSDGHWLKMHIDQIKIADAITVDYELLYKTGNGDTQGVPGSINLANVNGAIERDLLLGSESNKKFRYDEGVEQGTLTLRFRNSQGKLVGKLTTDFHLQSGTTELSSIDGKLKYTLNKIPAKGYFVTMNTFKDGVYGIFYSEGELPAGKANLTASSTGIFH